MKKFLMSFAVLAMGMSLLTACSNDDDENHGTAYVPVSNGAYVVCSGNMSSSIDGSLTYFDYGTGQGTLNAFKTVNGRSLGMTVNDALRVGSKLYVVVDGEKKVFVCDANTLKQVAAIDMTAGNMLGAEGGISPRRITTDGSKIYVSTYGGYVAAIDTLNFQLQKKYQAGSYPEGIAVNGDYLYVANSDYGNGQNPSISKINLSTGESTTYKAESIRNPQSVAVAGNDIYFLDYGNYDEDWNQQNAGVYRITGETVTQIIPDATCMAASGYSIYTINAPYGGDEVTYSVYNIQSASLTQFNPSGIESPAAIEVDPLTGYILIASYHTKVTEWGTFADYSGNGYVNVYSSLTAAPKFTFECGVSPTRIVINAGLKAYQY